MQSDPDGAEQENQLAFGKLLKDEGQERVLAHAKLMWRVSVRAIIIEFKTGLAFSSDRVQFLMDKQRLEKPHHPNAVGAIFSALSRQGYIYPRGDSKLTTRASGQSRRIPIWVRTSHNDAD